jgi:hypothetical protein
MFALNLGRRRSVVICRFPHSRVARFLIIFLALLLVFTVGSNTYHHVCKTIGYAEGSSLARALGICIMRIPEDPQQIKLEPFQLNGVTFQHVVTFNTRWVSTSPSEKHVAEVFRRTLEQRRFSYTGSVLDVGANTGKSRVSVSR